MTMSMTNYLKNIFKKQKTHSFVKRNYFIILLCCVVLNCITSETSTLIAFKGFNM